MAEWYYKTKMFVICEGCGIMTTNHNMKKHILTKRHVNIISGIPVPIKPLIVRNFKEEKKQREIKKAKDAKDAKDAKEANEEEKQREKKTYIFTDWMVYRNTHFGINNKYEIYMDQDELYKYYKGLFTYQECSYENYYLKRFKTAIESKIRHTCARCKQNEGDHQCKFSNYDKTFCNRCVHKNKRDSQRKNNNTYINV